MNQEEAMLVRIKVGIIFSISLAVLLTCWTFNGREVGVQASASGPSASHTDAPGENNCTACHTSFGVNSGTGSLTISGLPPNYLPGQQIPVTVTVTDPLAIVFGSQTTAIDSFGNGAGTFTPPPTPTPPPIVPPTMQVIPGLIDNKQRSYIEHTVDGIIPPAATPQTKTWTFTWTAPATRVGKVTFYTAANAADGHGGPDNDYIYTTNASTLAGSALANFDNDGKTDVSVFRPSSGTWFSINSTNQIPQFVNWGTAGDRIVPGDYDGDGITDAAVWRPSDGNWYVKKSSGGIQVVNWGTAGDIPVPGDYDGDLKADFAVFRPSTGDWFVIRSSDGAVAITKWGISTDKVVQGDYDGDGKTDVAVYRPSSGTWFIWKSSTNSPAFYSWGLSTDVPVQGDYDSDGKTDVAVWRPSDGNWYIRRTSDSSIQVINWGIAGDIPVPADYDGDGKTDIAVYRSGVWFILQSSDSIAKIVSWGINTDVPVPTGYLSQ